MILISLCSEATGFHKCWLRKEHRAENGSGAWVKGDQVVPTLHECHCGFTWGRTDWKREEGKDEVGDAS
jgi:hypothetical protein